VQLKPHAAIANLTTTHSAAMEPDRCTHIAVSLPAWFRCPQRDVDEAGEQAFHDGQKWGPAVACCRVYRAYAVEPQ
jgi:hypothetical protein